MIEYLKIKCCIWCESLRANHDSIDVLFIFGGKDAKLSLKGGAICVIQVKCDFED